MVIPAGSLYQVIELAVEQCGRTRARNRSGFSFEPDQSVRDNFHHSGSPCVCHCDRISHVMVASLAQKD
jgi:hypothetical protein